MLLNKLPKANKVKNEKSVFLYNPFTFLNHISPKPARLVVNPKLKGTEAPSPQCLNCHHGQSQTTKWRIALPFLTASHPFNRGYARSAWARDARAHRLWGAGRTHDGLLGRARSNTVPRSFRHTLLSFHQFVI